MGPFEILPIEEEDNFYMDNIDVKKKKPKRVGGRFIN